MRVAMRTRTVHKHACRKSVHVSRNTRFVQAYTCMSSAQVTCQAHTGMRACAERKYYDYYDYIFSLWRHTVLSCIVHIIMNVLLNKMQMYIFSILVYHTLDELTVSATVKYTFFEH